MSFFRAILGCIRKQHEPDDQIEPDGALLSTSTALAVKKEAVAALELAKELEGHFQEHEKLFDTHFNFYNTELKFKFPPAPSSFTDSVYCAHGNIFFQLRQHDLKITLLSSGGCLTGTNVSFHHRIRRCTHISMRLPFGCHLIFCEEKQALVALSIHENRLLLRIFLLADEGRVLLNAGDSHYEVKTDAFSSSNPLFKDLYRVHNTGRLDEEGRLVVLFFSVTSTLLKDFSFAINIEEPEKSVILQMQIDQPSLIFPGAHRSGPNAIRFATRVDDTWTLGLRQTSTEDCLTVHRHRNLGNKSVDIVYHLSASVTPGEAESGLFPFDFRHIITGITDYACSHKDLEIVELASDLHSPIDYSIMLADTFICLLFDGAPIDPVEEAMANEDNSPPTANSREDFHVLLLKGDQRQDFIIFIHDLYRERRGKRSSGCRFYVGSASILPIKPHLERSVPVVEQKYKRTIYFITADVGVVCLLFPEHFCVPVVPTWRNYYVPPLEFFPASDWQWGIDYREALGQWRTVLDTHDSTHLKVRSMASGLLQECNQTMIEQDEEVKQKRLLNIQECVHGLRAAVDNMKNAASEEETKGERLQWKMERVVDTHFNVLHEHCVVSEWRLT